LPNPENINYVPHITFIRPFYTSKEKKLIKIFRETCEKFKEPLEFRIENFNYFNIEKSNKKTFYAKVIPSKKLDDFVDSLEKNIEGFIEYESERPSKKRTLHATVITEAPEIVEKFFEEEVLIE